MSMRFLKVLIAISIFCGCLLTLGDGEAGVRQERRQALHVLPCEDGIQRGLTDAGKYYKEHNHSLEGYKAPEKK